MKKTVKQILVGARKLIASGWAQKTYCCLRDGRLYYCVTGAMNKVATGYMAPPPRYPRELDTAAAAVLEVARSRHRFTKSPLAWFSLQRWNDHPKRTKAQVLAALKKAADNQRGSKRTRRIQ